MRRLFFICMLIPMVACSSRGSVPQVSLPSIQPIPYQLALDFSSSLPDDYPVLSGPIETYQRIQVNRSFQSLLSDYIEEKESLGAGRKLTLRVELLDLQTEYESLGGSFFGVSVGSGFGVAEDEPGNIPQVVIKTARMTTRLLLRTPEEILLERKITVAETERIERPWFDSWTYDYSMVIEKLLLETILEIDERIDKGISEG